MWGHGRSGNYYLTVGLDNARALSGTLHRSTAFLRAGERLIRFADGDGPTVPGLQTEPVPAGLVFVHLELACHAGAPFSEWSAGNLSA